MFSIFILVYSYGGASESLISQIYFGVIIVGIVLVIRYVFKPSKSSTKILSKIEPNLEPIVKDILKNHLSSREKGRLTSTNNISPQLIPIIQEEMQDYEGFLANGVVTESRAKDLDNLFYTVLKNNEKNIKVKISGLFKHDYLHNGRLLHTPVDPHNYMPDTEKSSFLPHNYTFNFEKLPNSKYHLIGYSDDIMGNKYGKL